MKITWLGHSGFRIEVEQAVLLVDPWLDGNPMLPAERRDEAVAGTTHILLTHGHSDHLGDTVALAGKLKVPVVGIYDLITYLETRHGLQGQGFNKGGTVDLGGAKVTMVNATHSSSLADEEGRPIYTGSEAGYMIAGDGHVLYLSGDTDVMADMKVFNDLHRPDIGILAAGGHFTMDMHRAAYAARSFFDFKLVIPCHYRTFPLLAQDADVLREALPGVRVVEPEVLQPIDV